MGRKPASRELIIRAIVVSTRAAVRSHRATGRDDLVPITIERGETLLHELEERLAADPTAAGTSDLEHAAEELHALRVEPEFEGVAEGTPAPTHVSGRE